MAPDFLLDSDVCIDLIRGRIPSETGAAGRVPLSECSISSITLAELEVGISKSAAREVSRRQVDEFVTQVTVLDFDRTAARHYGEIRGDLEKKGRTIGPWDLLIASHARSIGATLITANLQEFRRVPHLKCQPWR